MLNGVQLTLLTGSPVPTPMPFEFIEALTNVTVSVGQQQASGFELRFSIGKKSRLPEKFFKSGGNIANNLRIILVATMKGMPKVLFDGVVNNHQLAPGNEGNSTLTIMGQDLTKVMDRQEMDGFPYPSLPASERVRLILAKYSPYRIVPAVVPEMVQDTPNPTERVPHQKGTDLAYINELAQQAGFTFYVEPGLVPGANLAYWGPKLRMTPPQKALSMNFDQHKNVEAINFGMESDGATEPVTMIQNPESKLPIPVLPFENPLLSPKLSSIKPPPIGLKFTRDAAKMSLSQAMQKAIGLAANSQQSVRGTGSLNVLRYGSILSARQTVPVRGAGQDFDGLYFVESVTHNITRGDYTQDFVLTRNGLGSTLGRVTA